MRCDKIKRFLSVTLATALAVTSVAMINTNNTIKAEASNTEFYDVTAFGANGSDDADDFYAINEALAKALDTDKTITVYIPSGTYYIGESLEIYSDTILNCEDDTILVNSNASNNIIHAEHIEANGKKCDGRVNTCTIGGYNQIHDVTINGGVWDGNDLNGIYNSSIMVIKHGQNININGITAKNCTNHMLNFSGTKDVVISDCTFKDGIRYTGKSESFWRGLSDDENIELRYSKIEAIHFDYMNQGGEPTSYPMDDTPCKNIYVQDCTFNNVFAGAGTHHVNGDVVDRASNFNFTNCRFKNLTGYPVNVYSVDGVFFSGGSDEVIKEAAGLVCISNCTDVYVDGLVLRNSTKNQVSNNDGRSIGSMIRVESGSKNINLDNLYVDSNSPNNGVWVKGQSEANINNCTFAHSGLVGIRASESKINVSECTVVDSSTYGIYLDMSDGSILKNNLVMDSGKMGIMVYQTNGCQVKNNYVTGAKNYAICSYGTEEYNTTAEIVGNTAITSKGDYDIYLSAFSNNVNVKNNIIGAKGIGSFTNAVYTASNNERGIAPNKSKMLSLTGSEEEGLIAGFKTVAMANGYEVQYSTDKDFNVKDVISVDDGAAKSAVIKTLVGGNKYYVRVRSYKTYNGARCYSKWSNVLSIKI